MITLAAILALSPAAASDTAYTKAERLMERAVELSASDAAGARQESLVVFRQAHEAYLAVLDGEPTGRHVAGAARGQMEALRGALEYDERGSQPRACVVNADGQCNGTEYEGPDHGRVGFLAHAADSPLRG